MTQIALTFPGFNASPSLSIAPPNTVQCGANGCLPTITSGLITLAFIVAILLSLAYLLWGGMDYITSGGEKTKLQKSRMKIIYAIIGLIVVFFAFAILSIIGALLGVTLTSGL